MAKIKTTVTEAPYDKDGNLMHYVSRYGSEVEWRENRPKRMTLKLTSHCRGRSAAYFEWKNSEGHTYPMFMSDTFEMMKNTIITGGVVHGWWIVAKRGSNFGVRFVSGHRPDGV